MEMALNGKGSFEMLGTSLDGLKEIIETLFISTSSFLRATKLLDLNKDVQSAIAEYAEICSIAKCRVDLCNAYVENDSAVNNESTYNRDSNFANKQISDRNILVG